MADLPRQDRPWGSRLGRLCSTLPPLASPELAMYWEIFKAKSNLGNQFVKTVLSLFHG